MLLANPDPNPNPPNLTLTSPNHSNLNPNPNPNPDPNPNPNPNPNPSPHQVSMLLAKVQPHMATLRSTLYGKRIQAKLVRRFPQLRTV